MTEVYVMMMLHKLIERVDELEKEIKDHKHRYYVHGYTDYTSEAISEEEMNASTSKYR